MNKKRATRVTCKDFEGEKRVVGNNIKNKRNLKMTVNNVFLNFIDNLI